MVIQSDSESSEAELDHDCQIEEGYHDAQAQQTQAQEYDKASEGPLVENLNEITVLNPNKEISLPENVCDAPALPEISDLDPDLISALGESTETNPEFGVKIHENLTKLWLPLLKKGMTKENKEKILKEYLIPDNCRLLQAPKLNAEISAAVPDMVRNRDKNLSISQQQLGVGITAINKAMDILLCKTDDKVQAMKHLSNGCRILCDLHSASTQSRIKLLTPSLDKTFLHVIQDAERDETVFGNKLPDKIKAAKAIEKQGLQIKKVTVTKTSVTTPPTGSRPTYSGNWPAPHRYSSNRGGRGGAKRTTPSTRRPFAAPPTNKVVNQGRPRAPAP
ncbi:uncharacterized protein LOC113236209 [Hyposmocoma kahamanoa]|uniref:uncharacterized protein LOC113236209 n=1 Tax=Hyposmocoma kahamanoa TaxID=1477025 RepID=UPI000E6D5C07|nr:uncharacterized protein LOC113236209 [Hyposmocoma kahamanoa]